MKTVSLQKILFIIMLFACKSAFAHDFEVDGIYYGVSIFNKNTAYVTHSGKNYNDAKEYSGSVVIPEKVSYNGKTYPVASIGGYAFAGCDELTSVTIPSSVKTINQNAFSGCTGLQTVECKSATPPVCKENVFNNVNTQNVQLIVPNASKSAYKAADTWKNLNYGVSIGDTKEVEGINYKVISESAVEVIAGATKYTGNIVIPNDVTIEGSKYTVARIANEAFSGCFGMTSVTIPSTVTIIGDLAFSSCTGLTSVTLQNPTPPVCGTDVFGGVNIQDIPLTVPTGSVELYKAADVWKNFKYLILIGDTIENYGFTYRVISETAVEVIAGKVKYEGDIIIPSEVIIEDNRYVVTRIGNNAFYECTGLKSIVLLNTISSIGNTAFYGCTGLTSVTSLNPTPPTCETDVFGGVNTQNIPLTVTAESVSLYKAADTWKNFMFTVSIGETKEYGGLMYRVISGTAVEVIAGATKYTGNITIPSEATIFGHKYNVIQIGADAFNGCTDLTSVIIPSTVTSIGNTAFYGCTGLTSVTSQNPTPPVCGTDVFGGVDTQNIPLTVPAESLSLYKTSDTWKNFKFPISIGETKEVGGLMYKVISETAVEVISGATKYAGNITISSEVTIFGNKYNVTQIGADAFNGCTGLTSVTIPNTVTSIGNTAFYGCTGLTSVTSQNPTPPVCGTDVFGGVDTQNIPLTVPAESLSLYKTSDTWKNFKYPTSIGETKEVGGLMYKVISETAVEVIAGATKYAGNITVSSEVTIFGNKYNVTQIGADAFNSCTGLTSVIIPTTVTSIGNTAFYGCTGLTSVTSLNTTPPVCGIDVFGGVDTQNIPLTVPAESLSLYKTSDTWKNFKYPTSIGETKEVGGLMYKVISETAVEVIAGATKYAGNITVSSEVTIFGNKYNVTQIGADAFNGCTGLTSVIIPTTITSIGNTAFNGCTGLTSVTSQNPTPPACGTDVFGGVNTQSIPLTVPNESVSLYKAADTWKNFKYPISIGETKEYGGLMYRVISETAVEVIAGTAKYTGNITIPSEVSFFGNKYVVTQIGNEAFKDCYELTSITIPTTVTSIGNLAFDECTGLISIISLNPTPPTCGSAVFLGVNTQNILLTVPDESISLYRATDTWKDFGTINGVNGGTEVIKIASLTIDSKKTLNVDETATITATILPDNATNKTLNWTSLNTDVATVSNGVVTAIAPGTAKIVAETTDGTNLSDTCVVNVSNLNYNIISDTEVEVIAGTEKYSGDIVIPSETTIDGKTYTVTRIGDNAFKDCTGLTSVTIPGSITSIGAATFLNCSGLTGVMIPSSVTNIGNSAFSGCNGLTSIVVESGNSVYDSRDNCNAIIETARKTLIKGCNTTVIPNSVTTISYSAFSGCTGLTSITIPNSVRSILDDAFYGCSGLTKVTIPSSVTYIANRVFPNCTGLISLIVESENTVFDSRDNCNAIIETATNTLRYGCKTTVIPNTVTSIGTSAFSGCTGLTEISIPNAVTNIGDGAFSGCRGLVSVAIGNSVINIGNRAFVYCRGLTSVTIPISVTSIGYEAFGNCTGLTSVTSLNPAPPTCGDYVFVNVNTQNIPLIVPDESISLYRATDTWKDFGTIKGVNGGTETIKIVSLTIDSEKTLNVDETATITATILPDNATNKTLNWTSLNTDVATVSNGVVTAIAPGTAKIVAETTDGTNLSDTCVVTIMKKEEIIPTSDVRIYINPGHGSWGPNNRHMATIGHSPISSQNPDTTDFYESNTNLQKGLALLYRLHDYGVPFDVTKNQTNDNPNRIGAALDLSQNLVMSHVKCGPYPYETVNGVSPDSGNDFNRTLSTIAAEVEANDFDMFISIHSNAATEGNTINYLYFAYDNIYTNSSGTTTDELGNQHIELSKEMSRCGWNHRILDRHTQRSHYDYTITKEDLAAGKGKIGWQNLGVLNHSVPGYLVEGYFHSYQPARHRYMNFDMCRLEGIDYARGVADYFGWEKETTGDIVGIVRDRHEKFTHELYNPRTGTYDVYKPLNGVVVTLKKGGVAVATYTTDENYNGLFAFRDLEPGDYTVEFSHADYKADSVYTSDKAAEEVATSIPVTVKAAVTAYPTAFLESKNTGSETESNLNYNIISDTEVEVIAGTEKYSGDIVIPSETIIDGKTYTVSKIGGEAFYECTGLTSVTIGNSVTHIGRSAFAYCTGLTSVTSQNPAPPTCGTDAFDGVNTQNVTLIVPDESILLYRAADTWKDFGTIKGVNGGVETIKVASLRIDSEKTLKVGESVTITAKILPDNATNKTLKWTSTNETVATVSNGVVTANAPGTANIVATTTDGSNISDTCVVTVSILRYNIISETEVEVTAGSEKYSGDVEIPSETTIDGKTYTVSKIGDRAFMDCNGLTSVTIPNSVTSIGDGAFCRCSSLISVEIGNSVTYIGIYAFECCSGLTSVTIPNSVTSIDWKAFAYCDGLTSVVFNAENCSGMGDSQFPVFEGCSKLSSVILGEKVKTIPIYAFAYCTGLKDVVSLNPTPPICDYDYSVFEGVNIQNISLTVPDESISLYRAADTWKDFGTINGISGQVLSVLNYNIISETEVEVVAGLSPYIGDVEIPSETTIDGKTYTVSKIGDNAFKDCTYLTSITIPNSVVSIGDAAFYDCNSLTSVIIPNSVTTIGDEAFWGSSGLTNLTIPSSVTSIGSEAFYSCRRLTGLYISDLEAWCKIDFGSATSNPIYYSKKIYLNNENVTSLEIPNTIISIKDYAFYNCKSLVSVTIPNSVVSIGSDVFTGCSGLTSISIPNSVTNVDSYSFYNCVGLNNVVLGNSVENIGDEAFYGCTGLTSVTSLNPTPPTCGIGVFNIVNTTYVTLTVPEESISLYKAADTWKNFGTIKGVNGGTETPSEPTLEEVWVHDMSTVGAAVRNIACVSGNEIAATNMAFSGGADNVIFFNANGQTSKTHDVSKFLSDNNIGTTNDTGEFTPYNLGRGIDVDGAGNIVVNLDFPNPTSATNFVAIAPDGTMKHIECEVPSPGVAARADFFGVTGNIFENAYIGTAIHQKNYVAVYNIYEGEQDADYSYLVNADEGTSFSNETKVCWAKKTFSEDAEKAPEFYVYNRSVGGVRYSDGTSATAMVNMGENFAQGKATSTGATAFEVNGVSYVVMPTPNAAGARASAFKIVNVATDEIVAETQGDLNFGTAYTQDFSAYVNEDGTVSIAQLVMGKYLAMYKFYPGKKAMISYGANVSGVETIEASDDEAEVEYYNLQGVRVYNPEKGIYIKKQGAKTTKVVL